MSLSAMILFGPPGFLFALKMTTHRKSEIIGGKAIRAIQLDLPWCQPVEQTFKSGLVTIPTFPVNQLACITAISFPDPEFVGNCPPTPVGEAVAEAMGRAGEKA